MTVTESGTLAERPLGSLLRDLADRELTGIVHIDGSVQRIVCLSDGRLYLARSSPGVSLQRALTDAGAVDATAWQTALEAAADHGSIVDALLAQGVPRPILVDTLRELILATLLELLVPDGDHYRIAEAETHQVGTGITFEVTAMLEETSARLERRGALKATLPSMATALRRASRLPPEHRTVELNRAQWRIVDALECR